MLNLLIKLKNKLKPKQNLILKHLYSSSTATWKDFLISFNKQTKKQNLCWETNTIFLFKIKLHTILYKYIIRQLCIKKHINNNYI